MFPLRHRQKKNISPSNCISLLLASLLGCSAGDPCDGQDGTCLSIDVQGSLALDTINFSLSGAVQNSTTRALPDGETALPVQVAVLLPAMAQGPLTINAVALKAGAQVGVGMGTAMIASGAHLHTALMLQQMINTCSDGIQDYGETDTDCGGRLCAPCKNGSKCQATSDCLSNLCTASTCAPAMISLNPATPVMPALGPTQGGITLTINGQSFLSGLKVMLGQTAASGVIVVSPLQVQAMSPGGMFGPMDLTVIDPDGTQATAKHAFSYYYGTLGFAAAQNFPVGIQTTSVAIGDVNRDGKPDLVVAYSDNAIVLLGKGDGTFQPAQNFTAGSRPESVAIGDFNGDGKPDLAVANGGSSNVSVLLGKDDGTFLPAQNFSTDTNPASIAIGDFNGDGKIDLTVANFASNDVSVLLGKGDGTFQPAQNFSTGTEPRLVAIGDFNGDGKPDLAVANNRSNNVSVLLGKGDGTFQPAQNFRTDSGAISVAIGDFNGDGKPDLAVANNGSSNVSVLLGKGDGTFQPNQNFPTGSGPFSVAIGDFNGDGKPDLAVANNRSNDVNILLNTSH